MELVSNNLCIRKTSSCNRETQSSNPSRVQDTVPEVLPRLWTRTTEHKIKTYLVRRCIASTVQIASLNSLTFNLRRQTYGSERWKGKLVPVYVMKVYRRSRGIDPLRLNAGNRWIKCSNRSYPVVLFNIHKVFHPITTQHQYIINNTQLRPHVSILTNHLQANIYCKKVHWMWGLR